jgi:GMP synthase (glutamine-hydrolysing)
VTAFGGEEKDLADSSLPVLAVLHGRDSSPGRIGQALRARGHALDIRRPRFGDQLPVTLKHHAGAIIFGGPMSANDSDDFIRTEIDWIGVALKEDRPFLGVCLGAQMLARHLGARVYFHPEERVEIGYYPLRATSAGAAYGPWPEQVYHWHREGFDLPAGAVACATGPTFENQAMAYGNRALGVQFHPEITYALVARWTYDASHRLGLKGAQSREEQLRAHILHGDRVMTWLDGFVGRWLDPDGPACRSVATSRQPSVQSPLARLPATVADYELRLP